MSHLKSGGVPFREKGSHFRSLKGNGTGHESEIKGLLSLCDLT